MNEAIYRIPTLETERLKLRPYRIDDWPLYREMLSGSRSEFLGGPFDETAA